jgi:hypothetical protein
MASAVPEEAASRTGDGHGRSRHSRSMCNLYSMAKDQQAIRAITRVMNDRTGNMPPLPGIFPDYTAPIGRNRPDGRELTMARWGMPSPVFALKGRNSDSGVTNVRNASSPHWRRLAWRREPVRRAVHQLRRARPAAGRQPAARVVRFR